MNTPAHLIFGAAAFAKADQPRVTAAALAGSIIPDLSLYFMVFWQMQVLGRTPDQVFGYDYRDPFWQTIFSIDNSIPLYVLLVALALWRGWPVLLAFAGAALLHVALDFPLHHNDGRAHFQPFTGWIYESPISYWDPERYGWLVGPVELIIATALAWVLWRRFQSGLARAAIIACLALETASVILPAIIFAS